MHVIPSYILCIFAYFSVDAALPTLGEVKSSYLESVTSVQSFECKFDVKRTWLSGKDVRTLGEDRYAATDAHLIVDGPRRSLLQEFMTPRGNRISRGWVGFDGTNYAKFDEALGPFPTWNSCPGGEVCHEPLNSLYTMESLDCARGEVMFTGVIRLAELFELDDTQLLGEETIHGHTCLKVLFGEHHLLPHKQDILRTRTVAWLDRSVGYLPRQIESKTIADETITLARRYLYTVDDFVTRTVGSTQVWFPSVVTYDLPGTRGKIVLRELEIGSALPPNAFLPTFPDLTLVNEHLPNRQQRWYVVGDEAHRQELQQQLSDRTSNLSKHADTSSTETPKLTVAPNASSAPTSSAFGLRIWVMVAVSICLVTAVVFAYSKSR